MKITKILLFLILLTFTNHTSSNEHSFNDWLKNFKIYALKQNISKKTIDKTMSNVIFLPKVIKYDRYQPEFYEDTNTYISKRTTEGKVKKGLNLFQENKEFILSI